MKRLVLAVLLAAALSFAQSKPTEKAPKESTLAPAAALELENLSMKEKASKELLQKLYDQLMGPIQARQQEIVSEVCKAAGIEPEGCSVDFGKRVVKSSEKSAAPVAADHSPAKK